MTFPYSIDDLKFGFKNPRLMLWEIHRILSSPFHKRHNEQFFEENGEGIDVMERDWDNLIILDACRYGFFEEQNNIDGSLEPVISKGGHSWEFMKSNFEGSQFHDTVYVTANPHARKLHSDTFYSIKTVLDQWDSEIGTVRPKEVVDAAIEANNEFPEKRLIVHFMQPHRPYLGPTADQLRERVNLRGYDRDRGLDGQDYERTGVHMWRAVKSGKVSLSELRQAYSETLDIVLGEADRLINSIDGRSVITADHGELLGERLHPFTVRQFSHPHGIQMRELQTVPWHIIEGDIRRKISNDDPVKTERLGQETINDRLEALGYKI
ncbi:hypothetical protein SAMN04487967_2178 [Natronorubrum sediminis]|uniref:Sulfatase n=1 Tax=Natronorubrum sediminis TaxID=640943 RepID=A0A1H6FZ15_9EURY|nr:hypothetical protein [Natronorubrum sediminis]SEH15652.1 hypothetical protein SAMN04487967_2178 [Natronorubrum sediminis]